MNAWAAVGGSDLVVVLGGVRVAQIADRAGGEVGQGEGVGAVDAQVGVVEGRQPGHVLLPHRVTLGLQPADGGVQVNGRPEGGAVEDEAERAELVLQAALVAVAELALLAVADLPGQGVAVLLQVADVLDVTAVGLVHIDELEDVQGLEDPPVGGDRLAERGGVAVALKHGDDVVGADGAGVDRGDHAEDILPVPADLPQVDLSPGEGAQRPVVGGRADPPALLVGQVRQGGPVGDAQQLQQPEDDVAVGAAVGHDDLGQGAAVQAEDDVDHVQGVPDRPRHDLRAAPHAPVVYRGSALIPGVHYSSQGQASWG